MEGMQCVIIPLYYSQLGLVLRGDHLRGLHWLKVAPNASHLSMPMPIIHSTFRKSKETHTYSEERRANLLTRLLPVGALKSRDLVQIFGPLQQFHKAKKPNYSSAQVLYTCEQDSLQIMYIL